MRQYVLFFAAAIFYSNLFAQPLLVDTIRFAFGNTSQYDKKITSPAQQFGYSLGSEFTFYAHVVEYAKLLSQQSTRVLYHEYGKTYEGRPLINLIISTEENIKNIEDIRTRHLKLLTANASEASDIIKKDPIFTSFSYNIHGNEASSTEAALQVAYHLAASSDQEVLSILSNSVIILYLCINPDGRDRYTYWYRTHQKIGTSAASPFDMEHYEPWPGGRSNHYWFDLNRDWVWQVHPESQGHSSEYQRWMPQVHVDYHEQGYNSNYFTAPGTTPRNQLLPDAYEPWSKVFGDANIKEFDKHKINYFTRDAFDFFYPGYGSSYPSVMGAIGMLTEQGGHSAAGRIVQTEDTYHLTLRQRIFDHYTTSLATLKSASLNREALLNYSYSIWNGSTNKSQNKAYFFSAEDMYSGDLLNVLLKNGVEVYEFTKSQSISNAKDYRTGKVGTVNLPKGTYVVKSNQPRGLFVHSLMERNLKIEDSVMYDMSTWSAPLAYNVEAWSTTTLFTGEAIRTIDLPEVSGLKMVNDPYAFVIDWNQRNAPKALAKLWEKGYNVRSAYEPFSDGVRSFPAGSLIVLVGRNLDRKERMQSDMENIAKNAAVEIHGLASGRMIQGMDLANTGNRPIIQPKVALLVNEPFSSLTAGQIYFLFDWEVRLPIDRVNINTFMPTNLPQAGFRFGGVDLYDYNVLILPGGGSTLKQIFGDKQLAILKDWVSKGGVLIATESAAGFFTKEMSGFTDIKFKKVPKDSSDAAKYLSWSKTEDYRGKKSIPGSALASKIDTTHPLAFGVKDKLYTLKVGTDALIPDAAMYSVGRYAENKEDLLVSGYSSQENLEHLAGQTFAGTVSLGEGYIVYLVDNTQYRMFWIGPTRFMINAVMQLPGY